ncbi:MAG: hypothetical protein AAF567_10625 [Actinomycetota bacterium]
MEPNLSSDDAFGTNPLGKPLDTAGGLGDLSAGALGADGLAADCQPLNCTKAMDCIDGARNPSTTPLELGGYRGQLDECAPCLQAFDLEVKLRSTMAPTVSELPSPDFAQRITQTLASVDLSQLDISDLEF